MSFFTFAELLKGAERSTRKEQVLNQLHQLVRIISVQYSVNLGLCEHYATQFTLLKTAGTLIGANDLWIACHALSQNAVFLAGLYKYLKRNLALAP